MKNIIIIFLVVVASTLGYLAFTKSDTETTKQPPTSSSETTQPTGTGTTKQPTGSSASGKTLDLSSKGLSEISKNLLDDNSVITLNVSGNNLTGSLPGEIRKLTNLEVLIASDNNMTGVPAEIGQLSKLRTVNFANNNLSGLPQEIGKLKNLQTLDLRGNPNISQNDISIIQKEIPDASILTD